MTEEQIAEMRRKRASKGGKRTAELGKSGFKTMTHEQRVANGKLGYAAMLKKLRESEHEDTKG